MVGFSNGHLSVLDCAKASVAIKSTAVCETAIKAIAFTKEENKTESLIVSTRKNLVEVQIDNKTISVQNVLMSTKNSKKSGLKGTADLLNVLNKQCVEAYKKVGAL